MSQDQSTKDIRSFDQEGLVVPRKILNPYIDSREKKDLHREMLWKMKFGTDDPKNCELQKAYQNYQQRQRLKEVELEQAKQMTFEKLLEEQKQRLHSVGGNKQSTLAITTTTDDYQEDRPSTNKVVVGENAIKNNNNNKNGHNNNQGEFYQVFSKVRAQNNSNETTEMRKKKK